RAMLRPRMQEPSRRTSRAVALVRRTACLAVPLASLAAAPIARAALPADSEGARIDHALLELRIALALAGLALFVAGVVARRRGAEERWSPRRIALGIVAVLAFAVNFNLFVWTGLHRHELYHYYLGSKGFPRPG